VHPNHSLERLPELALLVDDWVIRPPGRGAEFDIKRNHGAACKISGLIEQVAVSLIVGNSRVDSTRCLDEA
jgi:hypothetical protein